MASLENDFITSGVAVTPSRGLALDLFGLDYHFDGASPSAEAELGRARFLLALVSY